MQIRPMTEADLDAVLAIAASLQAAPQWPRTAYEAALDAEAIPRRIALVAQLATQSECVVAGFAVASVLAPGGEIESIAVAAGAQRRGIGRALLKALLSALRDAGAAEMALEVRESNRAASALYARAGFREVGRRRGYYREPVEDAVGMRLEMPPIP